ncbi:hypothetical protein [Nocardioides jishulii]|uniref:Thioesterase family protein n=1 Tax=Nocardioides jishulii TaxID=2575440 RepID=A0A4U2YSP0_9ACTN|nr:hypothetical protein [Nocardioides jishulii]QCX28561.1 hypothetical protein FCL41_14240 [Nocardioides jishulii]TKI64546.1 hypothetical protein FC770_05335 [Nocardioides jishulii]
MSTLVVPSRFCGPPVSANGGWTAGELASHLDTRLPVRVRLRQPPPLDVEMNVTEADGTTALLHAEAVVAQAVPSPVELVPVDGVDVETARAAQASYAGAARHPFPTCFACGPDRAEGDGLRIFPGEVTPVAGRRRVAATWTPDPSLAGTDGRTSQAVTWAALDCVGGWSEDLLGRPMVLGQMTARIDRLPEVGQTVVVMGEHRGTEGRKSSTASTLLTADGEVLAVAEHVWIAVDPARFS